MNDTHSKNKRPWRAVDDLNIAEYNTLRFDYSAILHLKIRLILPYVPRNFNRAWAFRSRNNQNSLLFSEKTPFLKAFAVR